MARSMTAFARLESTGSWGRAVWELRSVNHRYIEIGLRLPEDLRSLEGEVRSRISARLNRGKIDCSLRVESATGAEQALKVNEAAARQLITAAERVSGMLTNAAPLNPFDILRWPQVLDTPEIDHDGLSRDMLALLERALEQMIGTREREGMQLQTVVLQRCAAIAEIARELRTRVPEIIAAIRARHAQRIQELATPLDPGIPVGSSAHVPTPQGVEDGRRLPFHLHWQGAEGGDRHDPGRHRTGPGRPPGRGGPASDRRQ